MTTIVIPKKLIEEGGAVLISKKEYARFLMLQKQLGWEEKDTDEAIRVFKKEKRNGKLKSADTFASILK